MNVTTATKKNNKIQKTSGYEGFRGVGGRVPLEWVLEAQANKWSQRTSALQMEAQLEFGRE